jgi:hypothetical protein
VTVAVICLVFLMMVVQCVFGYCSGVGELCGEREVKS